MLDKLLDAKGRMKGQQQQMKREMFFINKDAEASGQMSNKSRYHSLQWSLKKLNAQLSVVNEKISAIKKAEARAHAKSVDKEVIRLCKELIDKQTFSEIIARANKTAKEDTC